MPNEQEQQTTAQPTGAYEKNRNEQLLKNSAVNHTHQNKLSLLIGVSLVLGVISILSLLFALKIKNSVEEQKPIPVNQVVEIPESTQSKTEGDNELENVFDPEMAVFELDKMGLDKIEAHYSDTNLEN